MPCHRCGVFFEWSYALLSLWGVLSPSLWRSATKMHQRTNVTTLLADFRASLWAACTCSLPGRPWAEFKSVQPLMHNSLTPRTASSCDGGTAVAGRTQQPSHSPTRASDACRQWARAEQRARRCADVIPVPGAARLQRWPSWARRALRGSGTDRRSARCACRSCSLSSLACSRC